MSGSESDHLRSGSGPDGSSSEPPPGDGEAEAFGTWLRRQREGREIDLREIAETSKISIRYLQALETGRFDLLPAQVFAKGFLRQYSRYVGLNPEEVLNAFLVAQRDPAEEIEGDETSSSGRRFSAGIGWFVVVLVLVLLLVGLVAWLGSGSRSGEPENAGTVSGAESVQAPSPAREVDLPGLPEANELATEAGGAESGAATPTEAEPDEEGVRVVVDFLGRCWIEATVDGQRQVAETRVQGESLQLQGQEEVVVRVGDAGAVEIEVDGEPLAIEDGAGQVRTWTFFAEPSTGLEERGET